MSNLVNVICRCDLLTCFLGLIGNRILELCGSVFLLLLETLYSMILMLCAGWALPSASYKLVFSVAISMVLAILVLELYHVLHTGSVVFYFELYFFCFQKNQ